MDETINTQINETDYDKKQAEAAHSILGPNNRARRLGVGSLAAASLVAVLLAGQVIENENKLTNHIESVKNEYQSSQSLDQEIRDKALGPVDAASIVGLIDITPGSTLNSKSIELTHSHDVYKDADQNSKKFIDYTIFVSGIAQGTYQPKDKFFVIESRVDGKDTLLVHKNDGIQTEAIPAPITH